MAGSPRSVESSVRVYEVLTKAYPASFRRKYGSEMTLVFREHITDVWRQRGAVGLMTAWFRVLGDLARTAPEEHLHEMQRRLEMKNAALAILSVVLAAMAYSAIFFGAMMIVWLPLAVDSRGSIREIALFLIFYLSAFLTGLILARVKPFSAPVATVPLGTMAIWLIWGLLVLLDEGRSWIAPGWGTLVVRVGFVASMGLASLVGCIVATKASGRLARFSVPWFQLAGALAVLVCTSTVAGTLRLVLMACRLANKELEPDLARALAWCLFALLVIAAVTIANLVLLVVRTRQKAEVH